MTDLDREGLKQIIITISYLFIIAMLILFALVSMAQSTPSVCLSKKEARQLWPKAHIYWYSRNHCWSNRRGPPRHLKMDPIVNSLAKEAKPEEPEDKCCWPDLERDGNGNVVEPPRPFGDRWNDQPWIGRQQ